MIFDTVLAFDHVRHRYHRATQITGDDDLESLYQFARRIDFVERELERTLSRTTPRETRPLDLRSNVSREEFERMVLVAKEHIAAGDIYQVVLSQRFETCFDADPFMAYRALRHVNPSPYMHFFTWGTAQSWARRRKCSFESRDAESKRIRLPACGRERDGGRRRAAGGGTGEQEERAEHVMLVDLGRNDLGRVLPTAR